MINAMNNNTYFYIFMERDSRGILWMNLDNNILIIILKHYHSNSSMYVNKVDNF